MWPFKNSVIVIEENGMEIKIHNKKEAMFMAEQWLRITNDCANLVNTTKNVDVFFGRYSLLIEELEKLSKLECFNCFTGKLPSQNLKEVLSKKEDTINDFISRFYNATIEEIYSLKTTKAKDKRVEKFYTSLLKYKDMMSDNHLSRIENRYLTLKKENV